jgi:hypothetical protein
MRLHSEEFGMQAKYGDEGRSNALLALEQVIWVK